MNKILKILTIFLLGTAHPMLASNNENHEFLKKGDARTKKIEENYNKEDEVIEIDNQDLIFENELIEEVLKNKETKEEKQKRIRETVEGNIEENKNNFFCKIFNVKSIPQLIISHLDFDSCGFLAQVCKMSRLNTTEVLEKFPDIAFKILYPSLLPHTGVFQLYVEKYLCGEKQRGPYFFTYTDFFLNDLLSDHWWIRSEYSEDLKPYQKSLMFYKKLICNAPPEYLLSAYAIRIEEEIIDPRFTYLANFGGERKIQDLFKESDEVHYATRMTGFIENHLFPLLLKFMLKNGLMINNKLFLRICFFSSLDTIRLALENTSSFDLNERFPEMYETVSYRNKSPIEIIAAADIGEGRICGYDKKLIKRPSAIMILMVQKGADISRLEKYPELYKKLQEHVKKDK